LLQPVGFSAVPATIPAGTLLYHLRPRTADPPAFQGLDWLAFDPQHSYECRNFLDSEEFGADLHTFAVVRPLRVLYFDGPSAAKTANATGLQNIIAFGRPDVHFTWADLPQPAPWMPKEDFAFMVDIKRADRLCELAKAWHLDGYVRNELLFEVVMCDIGSSKIEHRSSVNVSPFGWDDNGTFWEPWPEVAQFEYYRATDSHGVRPQIGLQLHPERLVTLYDPKYKSLHPVFGRPRQQHNLSLFAAAERHILMEELESVLGRSPSPSQAFDWSGAAETVFNRFGEGLVKLAYHLRPGSRQPPSANLTEVVIKSRASAFGLLLPFLPGKLLYRPPSSDYDSLMADTLRSCSTAQTAHWKTASAQELRLKAAIEAVSSSVCQVVLKLFGEMVDLLAQDGRTVDRTEEALSSWRRKVNSLVHYLDWDIGPRCAAQCKPDVSSWSAL
jgi:hypothetical protein